MDLFRDILLSIVYGITFLFPSSSTGNVRFFFNLTHTETDYVSFYIMFMRLAVLLVLLFVLRKDLIKNVIGLYQLILDVCSNVVIFFKKRFKGSKEEYYDINSDLHKKKVYYMCLSCLTMALVSKVFSSVAANCASINMFIAVANVLSGVLFLIVFRMKKGRWSSEKFNEGHALIAGAIAGIGIIPGFSRMALMVSAICFMGFKQGYAFKYFCHTMIIFIITSTLYNVVSLEGTSFAVSGFGNLIAGMIVCGCVAFLSYKVVFAMSRRERLREISLLSVGFAVIEIIIAIIK